METVLIALACNGQEIALINSLYDMNILKMNTVSAIEVHHSSGTLIECLPQEWHDKGFRVHWDSVRRRFIILNVSRKSFVLRGSCSSLAQGKIISM